MVTYDRTTAGRFGISPQLIDNTLYDAFGQRQVSVMYTSAQPVSRGHGSGPSVLAGSADSPEPLCPLARRESRFRLSAFAHFAPDTAPLSVNHQGLFPSVTISFNLLPGIALGDAVGAIAAAAAKVGCRPPFKPCFPAPRRLTRIR